MCGRHRGSKNRSGKVRELVQVRGLGDEMARSWAVNALKTGRLGSGSAFAPSKTRAMNVMGVWTRVTGDSGPGVTWRSNKPEEGSGRR
jgi:hypothetical protein